jgi:hypothetical protein
LPETIDTSPMVESGNQLVASDALAGAVNRTDHWMRFALALQLHIAF